MHLTKKRGQGLPDLLEVELSIKLFLVVHARNLFCQDAKVTKLPPDSGLYLVLRKLYFILACKFRRDPVKYQKAVYERWPKIGSDMDLLQSTIIMNKTWAIKNYSTCFRSDNLERLQYHMEQRIMRLCHLHIFEESELEPFLHEDQEKDGQLDWCTNWATNELCDVYTQKIKPEHFLNAIEMQYQDPYLRTIEPYLTEKCHCDCVLDLVF